MKNNLTALTSLSYQVRCLRMHLKLDKKKLKLLFKKSFKSLKLKFQSIFIRIVFKVSHSIYLSGRYLIKCCGDLLTKEKLNDRRLFLFENQCSA